MSTNVYMLGDAEKSNSAWTEITYKWIDYSVERVTAIPSCYLTKGKDGGMRGDESKRRPALLISYTYDDELVMEVHFGYSELPRTVDELRDVLADDDALSSDARVLQTVMEA